MHHIGKILYFDFWQSGEAFWVNVGIVSKHFGSQGFCLKYVFKLCSVSRICWCDLHYMNCFDWYIVESVRTEMSIPVSFNSSSTTWISSAVLNYFMLCFTIEISVALTSLDLFIIGVIMHSCVTIYHHKVCAQSFMFEFSSIYCMADHFLI